MRRTLDTIGLQLVAPFAALRTMAAGFVAPACSQLHFSCVRAPFRFTFEATVLHYSSDESLGRQHGFLLTRHYGSCLSFWG